MLVRIHSELGRFDQSLSHVVYLYSQNSHSLPQIRVCNFSISIFFLTEQGKKKEDQEGR